MSYPHHLGRFDVPLGERGLLHVKYIQEPLPVAARGALNPWQDARMIQLRTREDRVWIDIQRYTAEVKSIERAIAGLIAHYNNRLEELENHIDQDVGALVNAGPISFKNTGEMVMKLVFPPFMLPGFDIVGKLISGVFGFGRKAKPVPEYVDLLVKQMQTDQRKIEQAQARLVETVGKLRTAVVMGASVKAEQETMKTAQLQTAEKAYAARQYLDRQRADVLRERNQQAFFLPRASGGSSNDI